MISWVDLKVGYPQIPWFKVVKNPSLFPLKIIISCVPQSAGRLVWRCREVPTFQVWMVQATLIAGIDWITTSSFI